ncbi:MAG: UDP-N-acetylmuramoyl-L-alanyl-D-glutamate--2,6-diaminopimelate ligase [Gammaproteobacteria bacterium]|nr:UDP-N-acetylmuramoyl-L-alanyl-D-glutamate--2,6-diaminopimelate ligase [Gammaproteobacteria bacterium]MDH5651525.1 UDP-N-acetylmuramoyl-L-alanyl-D-glutamate--2,6-diaminopimelate ligase [Gammaproteobacteria bacterium]
MMAALQYQHTMMLSELLQGICHVPAEADRAVHGLCLDSRKLQPGDLFLAVAGQTVHGLNFVDKAIAAGAAAVVWEPVDDAAPIPLSRHEAPDGGQSPLLAIPELSLQVGVIADRYYGQPSKQMFVTGITGTNGKTSCSQFLAEVLSEDNPCAVIGTLGTGLYGALEKPTHTTPDAVRCHAVLAEMLEQGADNMVMEVSSHALHQGRVNGVQFDCAVFTNLSRDHLDYHGDMDSYAEAKQRLFHFPELRYAVINVDDEYGRQLLPTISTTVRTLGYGYARQDGKPDVTATDIKLDSDGIHCRVVTPWGEGVLSAPVLGRFNVSNLLAVLSVLLLKGMALNVALQRLSRVATVPGRMECLHTAGRPLAVIDYAHTPDALEQVLNALREHCKGKLFCVFGCGGDRDQGKRPLMGEIAARLADRVIITNDNPRTEDPATIINQIRAGIEDQSCVEVEMDRARAIALALQQAKADDIVLIAGKGHEDYQEVNGVRSPFSDLAEAGKYLAGGQ